MTDLVALALQHVATAQRAPAQEIAYLTAAGWQTTEIADRLGLSWYQVNELSTAIGNGVIEALRDQGYTDAEVIRTLRVPTARVTG